ncbi:MAG: SpoIIE family protein phosphatase [Dehalococcoidia bacterium]|nr:SpoIIE family protein phosphatase [Dehalococcoidia bacterium]MDD5494942.1 SpoIIE family protein phosphatase [Dehalococcoidia bacterium]
MAMIANFLEGKTISSRLLMALGAAILFGLLNWSCSSLHLPGAPLVSLRPQVAIPITMGLAFGPVIGFIVGFAGNVFGDLLAGFGLQYWDWSIGNGLIGAIPGILYLMGIRVIKTVGQFGAVLLLILIANLVGLSTGTFISSLVLHRMTFSEGILGWLLPSLLTNVLLAFVIVPLLLLAVRRLKLTLETRVILIVTFLLAACILGTTAILVSTMSNTLVANLGGRATDQVVYEATLELLRWAGLAAVIVLLAGSIISVLAVRRLTSPISQLCNAAKTIGSGDFQTQEIQPVAIRNDELGELARTLQHMVESLKEYVQELQTATAARERIESELRVATEIQMSMLPRVFPPFPDRKEFDIYATMKPAREVGGDLYDFFFVHPDKLCLVIGDVCGKGIPAALFMAITKALLKTAGMAGLPPDEMLRQTNDILNPENDSSMFVTVFCAILDTGTGELTFSNGGHPPPLCGNTISGFEYIKVEKGFVVGPLPDMAFTCQSIILQPGDAIFLYSDGVIEATSKNELLYSADRLHDELNKLKDVDVERMVRGINRDIDAFVREAPQADDITMLALRFMGTTEGGRT